LHVDVNVNACPMALVEGGAVGESGGVSIIWVEDDTGRSFGFFPSRFSPFPVEQLEDWL